MPSSQPRAFDILLPWGPILRGQSWGDGSGVVLLLHESGSDIDAWRDLPDRLATTLDLIVVAVDLPGHGLSDDPWEPERATDLVLNLVAQLAPTPDRHMIAAGNLASVSLEMAESLKLRGLVCLSPEATNEQMPRSPRVPKLVVAGSLARSDLDTARRLVAASGGWAVTTSLPVADRGTKLLAAPWGSRIGEEIVSFLRDCQQRPARHR